MQQSTIPSGCLQVLVCVTVFAALEPALAGAKGTAIDRAAGRPTTYARQKVAAQPPRQHDQTASQKVTQIFESISQVLPSGADSAAVRSLVEGLAARPWDEANLSSLAGRGISCEILNPGGAPTTTVDLGGLGSPSYGFHYLSGGIAAAAVAFVAIPEPPGGSLQLVEQIYLNTSGSAGNAVSPFTIAGQNNCGLWALIVVNSFGDFNFCFFDVVCPQALCPGAGTPEDEANCGLPTDSVNGGCNSANPVFSPLSCGQSYCATAGSQLSLRDTDWYEIVLKDPAELTWTVESSFPAVIGLVETSPQGSGACSDATGFVDPFAVVPAGGSDSVTACLAPGTYWWFVSPDAAAAPVGCPAEYMATMSCAGCP